VREGVYDLLSMMKSYGFGFAVSTLAYVNSPSVERFIFPLVDCRTQKAN
jgi:hypothetical protein